jgi:hypothetical protein
VAAQEDTMAEVKVSVRLEAWDDPAFRAAFERAREQVEAEGLALDSPEAGERAQHLLAEAGYPGVRIAVERNVEEALHHVARGTVHAPAD